MKKPIIQICFTLKTGITMDEIRDKMAKLKETLDTEYGKHAYECHSCHLSRKLCISKGFSTEVCDIFNDIFGDDYICELENETNMDEAMAHINEYRSELARKADKLIILDNRVISNVALELELFTQQRVMVI